MASKSLREKLMRVKWIKKLLRALPTLLRLHIKYFENRKYTIRILKKEERKEKKQMQFPKSIAILFVGTGIYFNYFGEFYENIKRNFLPEIPKKFFVFTDKDFKENEDVERVKIPDEKIYAILRYLGDIPKIKNLKNFEYVIKMDADLVVPEPISSAEFFYHNKPLFGVRHPYFLCRQGSFEISPKSKAAVSPREDLSEYIQCCFWGGKTNYVVKMVKEMYKNIKIDLNNGIIARIFDESYLNKYFISNKPLFYVYPPNYAYPDVPIPEKLKKKILHVTNKRFKVNYQKK